MLDKATGILADLIGFPTVSADSNLEMIAYLASRLKDCGAQVDLQHDSNGLKANLFATLGPQSDGGIVLSGHSDVVPVLDQDWSTDPFELITKGDRLYGRGTCDMKGFIAAALAMAPRFAQTNKDRPLHFAITYDEEVGCLGAKHLTEHLEQRGLKPGVAIIGEPTEMRIIEGHKGCYEYTTRFQGLEGHGSAPDQGVNAAEYAVRYVARLLALKDELRTMAPADSRFDPPWTTVNVGAIAGGSVHNVIAAKAQVDWEMRPVQKSDATYVNDALRQYCTDILLPSMHAVHPDADITTEVIGEVDGLVPVPSNEAVKIMTELTGRNETDVVPFGTEAGLFQDIGMDVVVCGPGSIDQAHKADEYLEISQLEACLKMLEALSNRMAA